MSEEGIDKFMEYLENVEEMITLFKGVKISTEIMRDVTISEEQAEVSNAYLQKVQEEWEKGFIELLEFGLKWLTNDESEADAE